MSWKKNKLLFFEKYPDEACFVLGIDLGNSMSSISYFDLLRKDPVIIDISGGYGKQNFPSVIQYVHDSKEWVFGEYALLNANSKHDLKLTNLMSKLGYKEYFDINGKPVSFVNIYSRYIKELIGNCKNLNPKAEVSGIVVSIPSYIKDEAFDELKQAFNLAGYEKLVISYTQDRECIFKRYFHKKELQKEKILLLDFGHNELRGGIYDVSVEKGTVGSLPGRGFGGSHIDINCLSSVFDPDIGEGQIESLVRELVYGHLYENTGKGQKDFSYEEKEQIVSFIYNYKDLIFQKQNDKKPLKLYYNFIYPPFSSSITKDQIDLMIKGFEEKFNVFISNLFRKSNEKVRVQEIDSVICTGGGFEMHFARNICTEYFGSERVTFYKNSKGAISEGAAIIAAENLSLIEPRSISISDRKQINREIGIQIFQNNQYKFHTMIEKNSFWWNSKKECFFIVNEEIKDDISIDVFERNTNLETEKITSLDLDNFSGRDSSRIERPKGVTRLKLTMAFLKHNLLNIIVEDAGFGDIFKKSGYKKEFQIEIAG